MVFVDLPKYLPPEQLWELVQQALKTKNIKVADCAVSFTQLKWSIGSIRKPNWLLSAPGVAKIAKIAVAILTMANSLVPNQQTVSTNPNVNLLQPP